MHHLVHTRRLQLLTAFLSLDTFSFLPAALGIMLFSLTWCLTMVHIFKTCSGAAGTGEDLERLGVPSERAVIIHSPPTVPGSTGAHCGKIL